MEKLREFVLICVIRGENQFQSMQTNTFLKTSKRSNILLLSTSHPR